MRTTKEKSERIIFIIISILAVLLPVIFFITIKQFDLNGLPVYFAQLGLYAIFYLLAFLGIKKNKFRLSFSFQSILEAIVLLLIGWCLYVLILSLTGMIQIPEEIEALNSIPAWKIWAQILSTWFFVGIAEELLFRGYILGSFQKRVTNQAGQPRTVIAVIFTSLFFSLWHLPVRIFELVNGEITFGLLLISILALFVLSIGFSYLYLRSGNILLVGLVHGVMNYPLIGGNSQLSFIILIMVIGLVELAHLKKTKK